MKIGPFTIIKNQKRRDFSVPDDIDELYLEGLTSGKKIILGTLIARSGTRWLCDIFSAHDNATGVTERYPMAESFMRYVHHYDLPVDLEGSIKLIKKGIVEDWKSHDISLVFSPYFSHSLDLLVKELSPQSTIIGIAEPEFTVQSLYNKGLFKDVLYYSDTEKAIGFQPDASRAPHHFFGRLIPKGDNYDKWTSLTRIGKISWWGNSIIEKIKKEMDTLSNHYFYVFNLTEADQNYQYYKDMAEHFGLYPVLDKDSFLKIKDKTVKYSDNIKHKWTEEEVADFNGNAASWIKIYKELSKL